MAVRFVIFLKVNRREPLTFPREGIDPSHQYVWEVRELLVDGTGTLPERAGPTLGYGSAATIAEAKFNAETYAELLGQEDVYLYDTRTMDPTPPSP